MVQHEADKRNCVGEDIKVNLELRVVDVVDVDATLVNGFDCADDEGAEADAEEVHVLLLLFDVVEEYAGLLDAVDAFFLRDVGQPLLKVKVLSHLCLYLPLWVVFICVNIHIVVLLSVFIARLIIVSLINCSVVFIACLVILILLILLCRYS